MSKYTLAVTKLFPSGAWEVAAIVGGYRLARTYYGYSRREAVKMYLAEVSK